MKCGVKRSTPAVSVKYGVKGIAITRFDRRLEVATDEDVARLPHPLVMTVFPR